MNYTGMTGLSAMSGMSGLGGISFSVTNNNDGTATWRLSGYTHPDPTGYINVFSGAVQDQADYNDPVTDYDSRTGTITVDDPTTPQYFTYVAFDNASNILVVARLGPRTITGYTDVAAYIDAIEAEGRTVEEFERTALYDDKTRGIANGWYSKMYDRVLLGWASANANRVRQKALTKISAFTAPVAHNAGHVDFAGGGYGKIWTPAAAFSSVNSAGNMFGVIGSSSATDATIDLGVRETSNANAMDLFYAYSFAAASFGNQTTARILISKSTMDEGLYLGHRITAAGRILSRISGVAAVVGSSGSLSSGGLSTHPMAIGGYAFNSASVDNNTGRKYTQVASFDGLTNDEADAALEDAETLELELGWRSIS